MDSSALARAATCALLFLGLPAANAIPVLVTDARIAVEGVTTGAASAVTVGGSISSSAADSSVRGTADSSATAGGALEASAIYLAAGGQDDITATAAVSWSDTFLAAGTGLYSFDFFIPGASLGIRDYSRSTSLAAAYSISIMLDGVELFLSTADLIGNANSSTLTLGGTEFGNTPFGGGSSFGFDFTSFSGNLELGLFDAGDMFTVDYAINVSASGPGRENGASASIGDPLSPGSVSLQFQPVVVSVSAPGSALLLLIGLISLAVRARPRSA